MRPEHEIHPDMKPLMAARRFITPAETPAERRANWTRYTSAIALPRPASVVTSDHVVKTESWDVPIRIYRQEKTEELAPIIVYLHGGGFMLGDLDSSDSIAWGLCVHVKAAVVCVDYRLTPDHPFPAAFDDCYGVIAFLAVGGEGFDLDSSRIAICGDSAGGSLAAACCLAARDRGGPSIVAQALVYPTLGLEPTLSSYIENKDGPSLTTSSMVYYNDKYFSSPEARANPYAAPGNADDVRNLPPAFIHTAEFDPIRDDGRVYAAKLAQAGNWVTYREARKMLHGFMRMREAGEGARAEFAALTTFLKSHLLAGE